MSTTTEAPSKTDLLADRGARAKKIAQAASRKATRIAEDPEQNRSTRQRAALKVKADALDQITLVLAGREPPA